MLLYSHPQTPYFLKDRLATWIAETTQNTIRIAKHGPVFVVNDIQEVVYVNDGTAFWFDEGTEIAKSFATAIEKPSKVFELEQHCFSAGNTTLFTFYDVSCDGKKIGRFVKYTSLRDRKVVESILEGQSLIEAGDGDPYWEMIKVLFRDI